MRSSPTARTSAPTCGRAAPATCTSPRQSVDNGFWSAAEVAPPRERSWPAAAHTKFLYVGRPAREKGLGVLMAAWRASGLKAPRRRARPRGRGIWLPSPRRRGRGGARVRRGGVPEPRPAAELRNLYAASDVLVLPSIPTRTFREPWGLVVNEAMNRAAGGDRDRRRRCRGRRAGARRAQRPWSCPPATALRSPMLSGAWRATRACGPAWVRPAPKTCARSRTTPGRRASQTPWLPSASPVAVGSVCIAQLCESPSPSAGSPCH